MATAKRRRGGRVYLPNDTVNSDLTPQALGVLVRLLGRPRGAPAGYREVMRRGFGEMSARKAMAELDAQGYRHLVTWQDQTTGRHQTRVYVYPEPTPRETAEAEWAAERTGEATARAEDSQARDRAWDSGAPVRRSTVKPGTTTYHQKLTPFVSGGGTNARTRPRCPTHPHRTAPCGDCAADHLAGEHGNARSPSCPHCQQASAA